MSTQTPIRPHQHVSADGDVARLVRAAAGGDHDAWNELVERFGGLVWSVARSHRLNATDAADVSQCTWMRLVEHLDSLKNPAAVGAWLATTARRECLRVLQASRQQIPYGDDLPEPRHDGEGVDGELLRGERDAQLWQAVSRLRAEDQALLRMLAADPPASYSEINAALGMPIGSIGPTRARCLERLRAHCEQLDPRSN